MASATEATTEEIGSGGLGRGVSLSVGIEKIPALKADRFYEYSREASEQDPTIRSALIAIESTIRRVGWRWEPANDTPEAKRWADFLDECFDDLDAPWPQKLMEILSLIPYGFSLFEMVYKVRGGEDADRSRRSKYSDNLIGWRRWGYRAPETIADIVYDDGDVIGWKQRLPNSLETVTIPADKAMIFSTVTRGSDPRYQSILKACYIPWYHRKEVQVAEAIGVQRDLAGMIEFKVPSAILKGDTPEAKASLEYFKKMVRNVHRGTQEGLITPSDVYAGTTVQEYESRLMTSGGSRQFNTNEIIQRYASDIAILFMTGFLFLGHRQTGTYSVGGSQIDFFNKGISGWLDLIADVINEQGVARLLRLNGVPRDLHPRLVHDDPDTTDLNTFSTAVERLVKVNALVVTRELQIAVAKLAGLPVPPDTGEAAPPPTPDGPSIEEEEEAPALPEKMPVSEEES